MISLLPTAAIDELKKQLELFFINITKNHECVYPLNALFRTMQPILLISNRVEDDIEETIYCHTIFEVMVNIINDSGSIDSVIAELNTINEGFENGESISEA